MLTPLMMFLFILVLFLISIYFVYTIGKIEGFLSFNKTQPSLNQLYIYQYSISHYVYKVYDSIYFDSRNGNIVELFGQSYGDNKNETMEIDTIGSSLTDIVLISRPVMSNSNMIIRYYNNSSSDVKVDMSAIEDKTINSFVYGIIPNESVLQSNIKLSYNYQILYVSWGKDTVIHVYDCSPLKNVHIGTFLFRNGYDPVHYLYRGNLSSPLGVFKPDINQNNQNNSFQPEKLYDEKKQTSLFQLSSNILFDTTCRYLIVRKKGSINVYDGTIDKEGIRPTIIYSNIDKPGVIVNTPKSIIMSRFREFQVLYILDTEDSNLILYMAIPSTRKTMIAIISTSPSVVGHIMVKNVKTFNQDNTCESGLDGFEVKTVVNVSNVNPTPSTPVLQGSNIVTHGAILQNESSSSLVSSSSSTTPSLDSAISNYFKTYWNEQTLAPTSNNVKQQNDFLLTNEFKTSDSSKSSDSSNVKDLSGNDLHSLISNLTGIKISENVDSTGNKTIQYNGSLVRNNYLDSILKNITGIQLSDSNTAPPTTASTTSTPAPPTTASTTSTPAPPTTTSTTSTPVSSVIQAVPVRTQPYQKMDYGKDMAYVYSSSITTPKPTFDSRNVSEGNTDYYSYYGTLPEKESSNFKPIASDFSKFGV